jgi:hypothetical protein
MYQKRFPLGALVPSDFLPELLALAQSIPGFAPLLGDAVRIGVVIDAQKVQQELRWRLGRREKSYALSGLHEAITSGVVIPFAPTFLDCEIVRRRRSALMRVRVVCLAARTPLSLSEVEKRIRADGYVSRARNLGIYPRRVLLTSGQFQQLDTGLWAMAS